MLGRLEARGRGCCYGEIPLASTDSGVATLVFE